MTNSEFSQPTEGGAEIVSPEQAFNAIGLSFTLLRNLPDVGIRVPNPLASNTAINFFLGNAFEDERLQISPEKEDEYYEGGSGKQDFWTTYYREPGGKIVLEEFLIDELPYLLNQQGFSVQIRFEDDNEEKDSVSQLVVTRAEDKSSP